MAGLRSGLGSVLRLAIMTLLLAIPILAQSSCINLGGASCHGSADGCHGQVCANVMKYGCQSGPGCFSQSCAECYDTCATKSEADCRTHPECSWDPSPTSCIGSRLTASCLGTDNEDDCKQLSGCTWGTS